MLDVYQAFSQEMQDYEEYLFSSDFQAAVSSIPEMSPEEMEKIKKSLK